MACFPTIGNLSSEFSSTISSPLERVYFHFASNVFWESYTSIFGLTSIVDKEKTLNIFVPTDLSWEREKLSGFILSLVELAEKCLGCQVLRIFPVEGSFILSSFRNDLEFAGFVPDSPLQTPKFYFLRFA
ncbi:hypothetical protein MDAP_001407 [Mitosporidium daphniae]|uniref:Ornithine decarboxylase antizyme n=1 Tax=Mitosporidium daphniae TaxID=1485682 RepID=A0A098VWC6_9MICR|nr:uncharacterized protein DI09_102p40 [Mitosporidium daphniae]KGG53220.1 hypothetical protein DI09_102p40 [Mitosporidium daphniae]|eukprot:XP_013239656.1 uncharacterized protein DI09_102p40 [Mitosporidium daphniae]